MYLHISHGIAGVAILATTLAVGDGVQAPLTKVQLTSHLPYSQWMASSIMAHHDGLRVSPDLMTSTVFKHGMFQLALERMINLVDDMEAKERHIEYIKRGVENEVSDVGDVVFYDPHRIHILDDLLLGHGMLYLYEHLGDTRFASAATQLRSSLDTHPRTSEGQYWYRADTKHENLTFPNTPHQAFVEQIYMLAPFCIRYTNLLDTGNLTDVLADMLRQFQNFQQHCEHEDSHLYAQGYDDKKEKPWADRTTGRTPELWGRANGWVAMALVDTLELLSISHWSEAWIFLHGLFVSLADAVVDAADEATGLWWQVMSWPGREGNFIESSASAMFVYALFKGVRLGYLGVAAQGGWSLGRAKMYADTAARGFEGLIEQFVVYEPTGTLGYNGTVQVRGLGGNFSYEFYIDGQIAYNDLEGASAFVMAAIEHELAQKATHARN